MPKESLVIKSFGPIRDVELSDIPQFLFLIGESGSGKSTVLKVLAMMRHIYKQLTLRSYLKLGNVMEKSIVISAKEYLRNGGMVDYVHSDTKLVYTKGNFTITYTAKEGLQGTKNVVIPADLLSLEKISFMSDMRGAIASLLANNDKGEALGFFFRETFRDFEEATKNIHDIDIPFLKIHYYEKKANNGVRKYLIKDYNQQDVIDEKNGNGIPFEDASSGMRTMTPLALIAEYFSENFDIVKATNQSVANLLAKNDSLASFKHDMNIGDISHRYIHMFIEEPELSLFPKAQRSSINMLLRKCKNAKTQMTLAVATHSPYIINHLNLLMKAHDKGMLIEGASLDYEQVGVCLIENGGIRNLKVQNAHLINTDRLSDDINEIYDVYDRLDGIGR